MNQVLSEMAVDGKRPGTERGRAARAGRLRDAVSGDVHEVQ